VPKKAVPAKTAPGKTTRHKTVPAKALPARKGLASMTDEHKAALSEGREQGRVVRRYLEAIEAHRPRRGRRRTSENITKRLRDIEERITSADPLSRLQLVQERMDLERELATTATPDDSIDELEAAFVAVAAAYSARKGLTYEAWRSVGVAPGALAAAGIVR
jgi:hypothetical protein